MYSFVKGEGVPPVIPTFRVFIDSFVLVAGKGRTRSRSSGNGERWSHGEGIVIRPRRRRRLGRFGRR